MCVKEWEKQMQNKKKEEEGSNRLFSLGAVEHWCISFFLIFKPKKTFPLILAPLKCGNEKEEYIYRLKSVCITQDRTANILSFRGSVHLLW